MRRVELPGRRRGPYHRSAPLLAACLAAIVTVGMSSVRVPTAEPPADGVLLAVERAWRAEFSPGAERKGVRRSAIWRVTATFGRSLSPSSPWYLVVGPEANAPERVDAAVIERAAESEPTAIENGRAAATSTRPRPRGRRRPVGAPDWHDPSGWNAWRLSGFAPAARTAALSLEASAADSLGDWLGLFDASGRRVAMARLTEAER